MPILEVEHISKSFNKTPVLKDVGFNLEKDRLFPSSDLPEVERQRFSSRLNFLEHPDNGIIRVNGETLLMPLSRQPLRNP